MSKWQYTKGLHDLGNGCFAYLQPDGSWGWSNAGLIVDGDQTLLVDTLFDLALTGEMLGQMRAAVPAANSIGRLVNTHANGDHTFGNQLVAGAEIIASRACAEEMKERPAEELAAMQRNWRQLGEAGAFLHEVMGSKSGRRIRGATSWSTCRRTAPSSPATSCSSRAIPYCGPARSTTGWPPATASSPGMSRRWCRATGRSPTSAACRR
jgi:hypothetical protein